ncbi:DUF6545 domain-containing protein [Amycolatopsis minnesotensis]|uniref:DUF6545 domain-containing protein n=1 Tax=Amycolatopsis minnesotensis TaxID=337894 RepID=UPI0031D11484
MRWRRSPALRSLEPGDPGERFTTRRHAGVIPQRRRASKADSCHRFVREFALPAEFGVPELVSRAVAMRGGRQIEVKAADLAGTTPTGMVVSRRRHDVILYPEAATPVHRRHIVAHEIAHLILGHDGHAVSDDVAELCRATVAPHLPAGLIRRLLGRTTFADAVEHEAELAATLLCRPDFDRPPLAEWAEAVLEEVEFLRSTITAPFPEVVLGGVVDADLGTRLYRAVVEIRDARLKLLPYVPPEVSTAVDRVCRAAGADAAEREAVRAAAEITTGLDGYAAGKRVSGVQVGAQRRAPVCRTVRDEAEFLAGVALAFDGGLVARVRHAMARP